MKKHRIVAFFLAGAMALSVTACGSKELPEEPYEAVPYRLYPAPTDAYVGDTMPFVTEEGNLELYYLYDTDHNGQGYHPVYKYSTDDFVDYEDCGKMLDFGLMSDPDPAIGTGSVMQDQEGQYHLFYTGHNDTGNGGKGKECVMHAVSSDRENWTKVPGDTFYAPENYSHDDFRDPEVFWVEEEQCYWLLIAARDNTRGGIVARYTSDDLKNWTLCDPLFAPMEQYMLECPSILHLGDKYFLTYSWDCVTYYAVSDAITGPYKAPMDNVLDGSGFIFYAAKSKMFHDKPYLCGWLGRAALPVDSGMYQWAGSILNHQLVDLGDGRLGIREPESFNEYFNQDKPFAAVKKEGKVKVKNNTVTLSASDGSIALADMGTRPVTMMLECDVTLGENGRAGFAFGGSAADEKWTALCLNTKENLIHYEGVALEDLDRFGPTATTKFTFKPGSTHHIKLVCENEVVVLYIDDTKALSNRIMHSIDGAHMGLFSNNIDATFSNITIKLPEAQ